MSFFFYSRIKSNLRYHIMFRSCFSPDSSWLHWFLKFYLYLMTLTVMRNGDQILYSLPSDWNFSELFLMIRQGLWTLWKRLQMGSAIFILPHQMCTTHFCWGWPWLLGWGRVTVKLVFASPFHAVLLEGSHNAQTTLQKWESCYVCYLELCMSKS
jgi:hypothetical protein